ncbi:flagellar export chaperone FliS [Undibacterium cyanobacteriorum]|uniref:Flagellar secretion chaperone FliS n=1 Tax=Undibacterium cyanobacteriorum TaxID=3073561 RepID=A0ABY9RNH7_9BURK|nr:flagellar export chaperone FliS [Undibacterium sp. 20NA77.5]WMW82516.1 flagellar export chaperone FliS [Undibacterium sp. 20NA77.5]
MFGYPQNQGANAYAKVGIETGVISASPHKLIVMLFDGAIVAIANATQHLSNGDIAAKGHAISKAIAIIENGLRASLDKKIGGEIAQNLDALYEYMSSRLIHANMNNEIESLKEVQNLLRDLKSAWEAISPDNKSNSAAVPPPVPAQDPLAPRRSNFFEA